jgi:hypothetical protein
MVKTTETSVFESIDEAKKAMKPLTTWQYISLIAGVEFFNHFPHHFQFLASSIAGKAKASGTILRFHPQNKLQSLKSFLIEQTSNDVKG